MDSISVASFAPISGARDEAGEALPCRVIALAKRLSLARSEEIEASIKIVRGQRVPLDSSLARLYGVTTAALNQAVRRNPSVSRRTSRSV
jgi:hypothetical protein